MYIHTLFPVIRASIIIYDTPFAAFLKEKAVQIRAFAFFKGFFYTGIRRNRLKLRNIQ
jgi:hypothetical protein